MLILSAAAATPFITMVTPGTSTHTPPSGTDTWLGGRIQATRIMNIVALGRWIVTGDTKSFPMGIWNNNTQADTGIRVTIDPTKTPAGNFGFATLTTPFGIDPNQSWIIGFQIPSTTSDNWLNANSTMTFTPDATLISAQALDSTSGNWGDQTSSQAFGPINFMYKLA
jgi:hypothetical protein